MRSICRYDVRHIFTCLFYFKTLFHFIFDLVLATYFSSPSLLSRLRAEYSFNLIGKRIWLRRYLKVPRVFYLYTGYLHILIVLLFLNVWLHPGEVISDKKYSRAFFFFQPHRYQYSLRRLSIIHIRILHNYAVKHFCVYV